MSQMTNAFNPGQTSGSNGVFNATLKGKINGLEETVRVLTDELNFYRDEINTLHQEKDELEQSLAARTQEIRRSLTEEVNAAD